MSAVYNIDFNPAPGSNVLIEYREQPSGIWITPSSPTNPTSLTTYPITLDDGSIYYVKLTSISTTGLCSMSSRLLYIDTSIETGTTTTTSTTTTVPSLIIITGTITNLDHSVTFTLDESVPCTVIFNFSGIYDDGGPTAFSTALTIPGGDTSGTTVVTHVVTCINITSGDNLYEYTAICDDVTYAFILVIKNPC